MNTLRQRVPFQAAADDVDDTRVVLDDVEQEELIADLRVRNGETSARTLLVLDAVLVFSALLQVVYLLKYSKESPLLALFPLSPSSTPDPDPPIPWPAAFTLLALALHANLALRLHPSLEFTALAPLPYAFAYALAGVAPTLSLFLARSWQATLWAAVPALAVGVAHSVHSTLQEGDEALAELEALKYRAPGP
ncbi:hypothetical protein DFH07DRAFT_815228 [Mycena maculata]|uniref:Uncharacterized protein n=1 Tax=Mycena maculata TaxID=230809 RepID=A0AAD7NHY8_9AGAR|nr:hypothetical protein DFH07DRAFT_815228 [Mycena maculata]